MKIILPPHKKLSKEVIELDEYLKSDIYQMMELVKKNKYENNREGYAVAHCQVSDNPYKIFVVREDVALSSHVIINAGILEKNNRYMVREACLSYPFRRGVKVRRYYNIRVKYRDSDLVEHIEFLEGLQAQIFQHEIDHFNGKTIYD